MNKADFQKTIKDVGICQWQVAERIGIREDVLSRKLRHDLSPEDEAKVNKAISDILTERKTIV